MYCEKCGTEMKVTDRFCDKCGNENSKYTNTEEKVEVNSKKGIKMKEMNVSKIKKYGVITGIIVLLLLSFTVISKQVKKNSYIKAIQTMAPKRYPSATFKDAFNNYFAKDNREWSFSVSSTGYNIIKFTGRKDKNAMGLLDVYFVEESKDHIVFFTAEANDDNKSLDEQTSRLCGIVLLDEIFEEYYVSKNYTLPRDLESEMSYLSEDIALLYAMELYNPVKYVKATSDMINKDIPVSATVMAETEPPTTVAVVETTPAETEPIVIETESSNDDFKINNNTVKSSMPEPVIYKLGSISPDDVIDAIYKSYPDDMTTSEFYIIKEQSGYIMHVEAISSHNPYYQEFKGYCDKIYSDDMYGLIFHFTSIDDPTDGVYVMWYDGFESIDHPMLVGEDDRMDYLYDGEYSFEENLAR